MINQRTIITINILIHIICAQDEGILNYQNQNFKVAEEYYESIIEKDERNSKAYFGKGSSLYMQDDIENAEVNFSQSLNTSEKLLQSKAYFNLGNISYKNNKLDEALQFYKKALELNPEDDEARYNYEFIKYQKKPEEENSKDNKDEEESSENNKEEEKKDNNKDKEEKEDEQKEKEEKKEDNKNKKKKEKDEDNNKEDENNKDDGIPDQKQAKQQPQDEKKSQDLNKAESILDALKNDEKVMQKQQLQKFKTKKLLKDW